MKRNADLYLSYVTATVFSPRLPDDLSETPLARRARELRRDGAVLHDLTVSNPTRAGFVYPEKILRNAFARAAVADYDPQPRGLVSTREAIVGYYAAAGGEGERPVGRPAHGPPAHGPLDPGHIHCTSASSEAYSMLFKLLCAPGDDICIPHPAYPLFSWLAALDAVAVRSYDLRLAPDGRWCIDMHALDLSLTPRTRAVIVVNPSNPAGNYLRPEEFVQLDALCARRGIALIVDEVFWDFPLDARIDDDGRRQRSVGTHGEALRFTINGLSKLLGLPQMKLGWIVTEGPARLRDEALARLDIMADAYLSVSAPVMRAAAEMLTQRDFLQQQIHARCADNLATALAVLRDVEDGGMLLRPEGGWSALLRLPEDANEEDTALRLLEQRQVLTHPGSLFDFPRGAYLVLSLLPESATFREAVSLLRD